MTTNSVEQSWEVITRTMVQPVNKALGLILVCLATLQSKPLQAQCTGKGLLIFYGNGMFNTFLDSKRTIKELDALLTGSAHVQKSKKPVFAAAYKHSEPILEQLANVAQQKGITDFETLWAWVYSIEQAPGWFTDTIETMTVEAFQ